VFDLAFAVLLVVAALRAFRARSSVPALLALAAIGWLGAVARLALAVDRSDWGTAGPLGLLFVGPTAILQERTGLAGVVTHPLVVALGVAAMTGGSAWALAHRARDLNPDLPAARVLHRAELAFVAAASFAGIRAVAALLALAIGRER
jgi:hypothetical protein